MSEYTDRLVQQTEAMLHFRHDETLTETSPERLHEALSDVIMMEINDRWSRTRHTQQKDALARERRKQAEANDLVTFIGPSTHRVQKAYDPVSNIVCHIFF